MAVADFGNNAIELNGYEPSNEISSSVGSSAAWRRRRHGQSTGCWEDITTDRGRGEGKAGL
jgi:hypothetical protein